MAILREEGNDRMVQVGDKIKDFRGDEHVVQDWYSRPPPSTGRVVTDRGEFYPHVIGCYIES